VALPNSLGHRLVRGKHSGTRHSSMALVGQIVHPLQAILDVRIVCALRAEIIADTTSAKRPQMVGKMLNLLNKATEGGHKGIAPFKDGRLFPAGFGIRSTWPYCTAPRTNCGRVWETGRVGFPTGESLRGGRAALSKESFAYDHQIRANLPKKTTLKRKLKPAA
jgi:hypothetical protein